MDDLRDPQFYAGWTEEELESHIKRLTEILRMKQGVRPTPEKGSIKQMLDPNSDNYMGSGMTLTELTVSGRIREFQNNITNMPLEERRRRRALLVELGAEIKAIRQNTRFATMVAEQALEAVISGDWSGLRDLAQEFTFAHEDEWCRMQQAPHYAKFVELCMKGFDTRPGAETVASVTKN